MGLKAIRAKYKYENAKIDRRLFIQIAATGAVGFVILIGIGFFDNDPWGAGLFGSIFFGISAGSSYLAKQSHEAMKYWEQQYERYKTTFEEEYYA